MNGKVRQLRQCGWLTVAVEYWVGPLPSWRRQPWLEFEDSTIFNALIFVFWLRGSFALRTMSLCTNEDINEFIGPSLKWAYYMRGIKISQKDHVRSMLSILESKYRKKSSFIQFDVTLWINQSVDQSRTNLRNLNSLTYNLSLWIIWSEGFSSFLQITNPQIKGFEEKKGGSDRIRVGPRGAGWWKGHILIRLQGFPCKYIHHHPV